MVLKCANCGKPIRQATLKELNRVWCQQLAEIPLEWYIHEGKGSNNWLCDNAFDVARAPKGTKWIGKKPLPSPNQAMLKKRERPSIKCGTCGLPIKPVSITTTWDNKYVLYIHSFRVPDDMSVTVREAYCYHAQYYATRGHLHKMYKDHRSGCLYMAHVEPGYIGRMYNSKKHMRRRKGYVKKATLAGTEIKLKHYVGPKGRKFKEIA